MSTDTPRTDAEEANLRAEWLHAHNAPKDWVILREHEVAAIKRELAEAQKDKERALDLLDSMLHVAENCDETGYADGVGFVNIDNLYDEVRTVIARRAERGEGGVK